MRINELLFESAMSVKELGKHDYLNNFAKLIKSGTPIKVAAKYQNRFGETVVLAKNAVEALTQILDGFTASLPLSRESINYVNSLPINSKNKIVRIPITAVEKSPEIKGKTSDFNIGGIGEICLGVAATTRFMKMAQTIDVSDFIKFANQLNVAPYVGKTGVIGSSLKLTYGGMISHANGKQDKVLCLIVAPGRDVKTFMDIMKNPSSATEEVKSTILSSISYANDAKKIEAGIERTSKDPNTNNIEIVADGQSNNKGTKADLVMNIDGSRINLISAKTGPSQLGQASGKEFYKQVDFFKTVFGVDISALRKSWVTDGKADNTPTLEIAWQKYAIPKILRLTGGDSVQKEKELVQSITNGLIRYANDHNTDTGESETVDIIKLITTPGSPGYTLMRIDSRLEAALEKVDLYGYAVKGGKGISVAGIVNGKKVELFRAWSYYTTSGQVTRTCIGGGPLLDMLATIPPEEMNADTELKVTHPKVPQQSTATPPATKFRRATAPVSQQPSTPASVQNMQKAPGAPKIPMGQQPR